MTNWKAERNFSRQIKAEISLLNISNIKDANRYLIETFIPEYNKEFSAYISKVKYTFIIVDKDMVKYNLGIISRKK